MIGQAADAVAARIVKLAGAKGDESSTEIQGLSRALVDLTAAEARRYQNEAEAIHIQTGEKVETLRMQLLQDALPVAVQMFEHWKSERAQDREQRAKDRADMIRRWEAADNREASNDGDGDE